MKRSSASLVLALLALLALPVGPALAALEVVVSVSPAEGIVGRPVEVLLRTFAPFGRDAIELPVPSMPVPAPSGLWNVLYPVADYPFDVVAEADDRTTVAIAVSRDPADATLWRGTFTPQTEGLWTISVRNFSGGTPGASARLRVAPGETVPLAGVVGVAGLLVGALVGLAIGRWGLRRSRPTF